MGSIWLHDLPDVISSAGLPVDVWPGWETRSRGSGGYDALLAVGVHHDASSPASAFDALCSYVWGSADDEPIGALYLWRDGRVRVGAAGATNTQGKGGPYSCSGGTIPLDEGNRYTISIEAGNNGVGEAWPQIMVEHYVELCSALCRAYKLDPSRDVVAHFEWTSRKIDPAGPSPYASGSASWNMPAFRRDVVAASAPTPMEEAMYLWRDKRYNDVFAVGAGALHVNGTLSNRLQADGVQMIVEQDDHMVDYVCRASGFDRSKLTPSS
jgi:hypothetical protein